MFGRSPAAAAGFVGLLSLFNLAGRFAWSSASDRLGRKRTYDIYLGLGFVLYLAVPTAKSLGSSALFVACTCVILSMYGGGFATVPAYLRDLFGVRQVGAIHGRLLTAWSTAALVGPSIVTYAREYQIRSGIPKSEAYSKTMYALAALLAIGFVSNRRVRPPEPAARRYRASLGAENLRLESAKGSATRESRPPIARLVAYWTFVAIPLAWGIGQVALKSLTLFRP
jgi:MFS family permease